MGLAKVGIFGACVSYIDAPTLKSLADDQVPDYFLLTGHYPALIWVVEAPFTPWLSFTLMRDSETTDASMHYCQQVWVERAGSKRRQKNSQVKTRLKYSAVAVTEVGQLEQSGFVTGFV